MIGSFVSVAFWGAIGVGLDTGTGEVILGLLVTLVVAMLACGSLNVLIERVGYRPLRTAPKLAPRSSRRSGSPSSSRTWGSSGTAGRREASQTSSTRRRSSLDRWGFHQPRRPPFAIAATVPLVLLLTTFVARTRFGRAMRATAQDPEAARLMGINVDTTISLTFLLGGLMAGAAGLIYALYQTTIWYFQGFTAGLIAFTAAVMGGIGNLYGAVWGA